MSLAFGQILVEVDQLFVCLSGKALSEIRQLFLVQGLQRAFCELGFWCVDRQSGFVSGRRMPFAIFCEKFDILMIAHSEEVVTVDDHRILVMDIRSLRWKKAECVRFVLNAVPDNHHFVVLSF